MKISYNWLKDYISLEKFSYEEIACKLTDYSFEVEEFNQIGGLVSGPIKVGEILEITPHPNANKIRLTKVKIDNSQILDIVCGANNIEVGQYVPVALPGACVVNRVDNSKLIIKEAKIRGESSFGMLCSSSELGIDSESSGIYLLDKNCYALGDDIIEKLNLYGDCIFSIEPRSNRPDALSHYGIARELSIILDLELREPVYSLSEIESFCQLKNPATVSIADKTKCSYFALATIENCNNIPTPLKIKQRLESIGVKSKSFVVDITNYILHDIGQPMHAYDKDKLNNVFDYCIREATQKEEITALDSNNYILSNKNLLVANSKAPLAIAGIMGGQSTQIDENTKNVILEAAVFDSSTIRISSRSIGLSSDSSLRFERGVIQNNCLNALKRAINLIVIHSQHYNSQIKYSNIVDDGINDFKTNEVSIKVSFINSKLNININKDYVVSILTKIGCTIKESSEEIITFRPPSYRIKDIKTQDDIVEEIARYYGYNNIPLEPIDTINHIPVFKKSIYNLKDSLVFQGFNEIWTSSLTSKERSMNKLNVLNPASQDFSYLRRFLIPSNLEVFNYNYSRQQENIHLFEIGNTYKITESNDIDLYGTKVIENKHLSILSYGHNLTSNWQSQAFDFNNCFFNIKGVVQNIFNNLKVSQDNIQYLSSLDNNQVDSWGELATKFCHPKRTAFIQYKNKDITKIIGIIAEISPYYLLEHNIKKRFAIAEINVAILDNFDSKKRFHNFSTTPIIYRDITLDCQESIEYQELHNFIDNQKISKLLNFNIIGLYKQIDKNSITIRFAFQDNESSLDSNEIEIVLNELKIKIANHFSIKIRSFV